MNLGFAWRLGLAVAVLLGFVWVYSKIDELEITVSKLSTGGDLNTGAIKVKKAEGGKQDAPVAMPSVRLSAEEESKIERGIYKGVGDKPHLGGFTDLDLMGITPRLWKFFASDWIVKSVVDVGCGKGVSASWFHLHGMRTLCVEGSHDAVEQTLLPHDIVVEHDFTRGEWWPQETYDLAWSVEFLEHVSAPYIHNYMSMFKKAAVLVVTHSKWGGWHHVEVHNKEWWISRFVREGFVFSESLTNTIHKVAATGQRDTSPNGKNYVGQHLWLNGLVFLNTAVASLPEHAHLFSENGCFVAREKPNKPCEGPDALPDEYLPLTLTADQDRAWEELVFGKKDDSKKKPDSAVLVRN